VSSERGRKPIDFPDGEYQDWHGIRIIGITFDEATNSRCLRLGEVSIWVKGNRIDRVQIGGGDQDVRVIEFKPMSEAVLPRDEQFQSVVVELL